jgi:hypothetical protein
MVEALLVAVADRLGESTHTRMARYDELWSRHGVAAANPIEQEDRWQNEEHLASSSRICD